MRSYPQGELALFGMGCFRGASAGYGACPGRWPRRPGYACGYTPNPACREVCSGQSGHAEVVQVVCDLEMAGLEKLLKVFWDSHGPTQGMRQGSDSGTRYRSAVYTFDAAPLAVAETPARRGQVELDCASLKPSTT